MRDGVISRLQSLIAPCAERFDVVPEHWIHGWDEGLSFCFECAKKKVVELLKEEPDGDYLVDGGWGVEGDSQPFCETCGRALDNSYTEYAVEVELDHFEEHGVDLKSPDDCHAILECTYALGCGNDELSQRLEKLALIILEKAGQVTA